MRLELNIVHITKAQFADATAVRNGVLSINRHELKELVKQDTRLTDVAIELANPGDKCRIVNVADVIEPRARIAGSGPDFPGAVGKQGTAGHGTTCVLRGAAVLINDYNIGGRQYQRPDEGIIDMWGPGAEIGPYGRTCNVVVLASPANGTSTDDYCVALKIAGLKTAVYLAKAAVFRGFGALPLAIVAKGLIVGSTLMAGAFIAKRFVLKMDAARFRLLMDGLLLLSGLALLSAAMI